MPITATMVTKDDTKRTKASLGVERFVTFVCFFVTFVFVGM
jgi:hypothetical protein